MEQGSFTVCVEKCGRTIGAIEADLALLEASIDQVILADKKLKRLKQIIMSVPGGGRVTALQILLVTNEFKTINKPKKFACYVGIAPFQRESGTKTERYRRVSRIADKQMKSLLHICALIAIRRNGNIRAYYEKKILDEKKPKLSALNAVRNKLVKIIFACVRKGELYVKDYTHEWPSLQKENRTGCIREF